MKSKRPAIVVTLFPSAWAEPEKPDYLTGRASEVWDAKVEGYRKRGMSIAGCEDALAAYCMLQAQILSLQAQGEIVPAAFFGQLRIYASEFFDTPASRRVQAPPKAADNPFVRNARA